MIAHGQIWRYVGRRFLVSFLGVTGLVVTLIFFVEMLENLRRVGNVEAPIWVAVMITGLRLPWLSEQVLPFAILLAAMATFLTLSRSLELVVIRASGLSVWQFIAPVMIVAFTIGALATAVYNPVAAQLLERHQLAFAEWFNGGQGRGDAWLRQNGEGGSSVFYAGGASSSGEELTRVTAYLFDETDAFTQRIEAEKARLEPGQWQLLNAHILETGSEPVPAASVTVSTYLNAAQVRENLANAETIGFWRLAGYIDIAKRSGLNATPLQLQFHSLLSQPILFMAMALIAGTFSLRLFRYGNIGRMILGGIGTGFLLYVGLKLTGDLGAAGFLAPSLSAWTPGLVTLLLGGTLLLFQEDG